MFCIKDVINPGLACTGDSFFACRILQQLCIYFFAGQLNIAHHRTTNETVLHRSEIDTFWMFVIFISEMNAFLLK